MKFITKCHLVPIASVIAIFLLSSCGTQSGNTEIANEVKNLKVRIDPTEPSYHELFDSCQVIKLESAHSSILAGIDKAQCVNDSIVLFDMRNSTVCLFAPNGEFLNRIGEKGEGPEDYLLCYDFAINPTSEYVSLLSPYGELINYTLNGKFIDKKDLHAKPNYFACSWMDSDHLALWSAADKEEGGVSVADLKSGKKIYEDWYNDRMLNMSRLKPFYNYDGRVFFSAPMTNDIYEVTDSCLRLSYQWDFGKDNISDTYITEILAIENPSERNNRLISDMQSGALKFIASFNGETKRYYYVTLSTGIGDNAETTSVFYDKSKNKSIVFSKFKEGMSFTPIFMNEKLAICQIPYQEIDLYNQLFDYNFKCDEDENPLLVKFYFKN